ncbi:MAG: S1C family serine protease [Patescibacteria group bacterium]|nr:S1C family serine protease [Patescibacteria group bacterium]
MLPPHLPHPACNIKNHERWINIKSLIVVTVFGLAAGISGAAVMLGWIWPNGGGGNTWVVSQNNIDLGRGQLDALTGKESAEKIYNVFTDTSRLDAVSYLNEENKLTEAVAVSSDGWLAMYVPKTERTLSYKKWRIAGANGTVYKIDKFLFDERARLAYAKVSPLATAVTDASLTQFKVAGFSDSLAPFDDVFARERESWLYGRVGSVKYGVFGQEHLDSGPNRAFVLEGDFSAGSVVINSRGRLVGFVMDGKMLLPGSVLIRILPKVLSQEKIVYPTLGVAGWFGWERGALVNGEILNGFAVERVLNKKTVLRRGDIITAINGAVVSNEESWYNIANKEVKMTVTRAGKILELTGEMLETGGAL